jgi:hypothetical protein
MDNSNVVLGLTLTTSFEPIASEITEFPIRVKCSGVVQCRASTCEGWGHTQFNLYHS